MSKGLIGKKIGMTSVFTPEGTYLPVTVLEVGPCVITQIKTRERDGYNALQLGFGEKKKKSVSKPLSGHLKKAKANGLTFFKEFRVDDPEAYELGQAIDADFFTIGEKVNVVGWTKGHGFSGVMRRHGFSGGRKTHGSHSHRIPGSIGCSAYPARVIKGKKMPGQYGNTRKTIKGLEIVDVRPEQHLVLVKGAVPGSNAGFVMICSSQEKQ